MARPSSPDSGPIRMATPSCSTSLRASLTALSGEASDDPLITSIFLPPAVYPASLNASSAPRTPSWPSTVNAPSSVASNPTLIVPSAHANCGDRKVPPSSAAASSVFLWFFIISSILTPDVGTLLNLMPAASRFAQGFGGQMRRKPTPETEQAVWRREDDD